MAQNFTANVLLALGAIPSMTVAPEEVGEFAARADALLVNLGTLDRERRQAAEIAIQTATEARRPWLLDPVFIDRSPRRAALARVLVARGPAAVRLNGDEFSALAESPPGEHALKRYAADQRPINLLFRHKRLHVVGLDGAAVEDSQAIGMFLAKGLGSLGPDQ